MSAAPGFTLTRIRCHWRPIILVAAGLLLVGLFWFASRYPQLYGKADHVGEALPSMAFSSTVMKYSNGISLNVGSNSAVRMRSSMSLIRCKGPRAAARTRSVIKDGVEIEKTDCCVR